MDTNLALRDLLTPAVALLAATGAISGVILTLVGNRRSQAKRHAFEAYNGYITDCLAEPELASGEVKFPQSNEGVWKHEFYKYEWLVARFLGAAEEVLEASSRDDWPFWYEAIYGDARWHKKYFSSRFFEPQELKMGSPEIREIIFKAAPEAQKRFIDEMKR